MAFGTYTQMTLGQAWADMASRLYDPGNVRWPTEELTIYIQQAIRTYNALTNHFCDTATFTTVSGTTFYDLGTIAPALRGMTFTVRDAVDQILWQLLEPPLNGNLWTGTQQYSLADILQAVQQARDTFLLETGVVIVSTPAQAVGPVPADGVIALSEEVINLRRLAWRTQDGIEVVLRRDDQWGLTNYGRTWSVPETARPIAYSISAQPPLEVQIAPLTTTPAVLSLLTINRGAAPNLLLTQPLGVPDDWAWVVIFGALAQLLQRDGLALDPARAAYCESRWDDGLDRAKLAAVVLAATVSGTPITIGAVSDADMYSATWSMVPGTPQRIVTAGHTIVATWPPAGVPPLGGGYTVALQLVRNAPVPTGPNDFLQIGPELTNDILDYAQHLASLKEGVGELQGSMALLDQFMQVCGTTLKIQKASQPNEPAAVGQTPQDARTVPYEVAP